MCNQSTQSTGVEGKGTRISSMKSAVTDTFPEPNRRLLQRFSPFLSRFFLAFSWVSEPKFALHNYVFSLVLNFWFY